MAARVGWNDTVLVVSLLYLSVDIQFEWEGFSGCRRPIHKWLLVSYGLIVVSRLVYIVGTLMSAADAGDFLLDLRPKNMALRMLNSLTWLVIVPFFTVWSMLGTAWIWEVKRSTPRCLPNGLHLWFLVTWQVLSYLWIVIHCGLASTAWILERRLRKAEVDLRQVEDADVLSRWGQVSRLQGYTSLSHTMATGAGLSASEISSLPSMVMPLGAAEMEEECPICLHVLKPGDTARQLSVCGHTFHRPCIDLWLLRRADCPLCKRDMKTPGRRPP